MKVRELLEQLKAAPPGATVQIRHSDGCNECNPYGFDNDREAYRVLQEKRKRSERSKFEDDFLIVQG